MNTSPPASVQGNCTDLPSGDAVTVIMPVYNQASFIRCAVHSLLNQTHVDWELIIIDDGSTDNVYESVSDFIESDERIHYVRNDSNMGLGHSLNRGLDLASYGLIAYLPADDIFFTDHLTSLVEVLKKRDVNLAYSGLVYSKNDISGERGRISVIDEVDDKWLQLVQVMHRKTPNRWMERSELATDDLNIMFWHKFMSEHPRVAATGKVTCEWVSHIYQRHRIMNDRAFGGIYMYKTYYNVKEPIKYKSSLGSLTDEIAHYEQFRAKPENEGTGLKILIVGELSYNPERLYSLQKRGHKLYGLWINNPLNYSPSGNLAFGDIENIPYESWEHRVDEIKPDIIYAQMNYMAVDLAYHVFKKRKNTPFVWHFKEGPFFCRYYGTWNKLMEMNNNADGVIYINSLARDWYHQFMPSPNANEFVLDGDLPPSERFEGQRSQLLSELDGEPHTFVAGRLFGINADDLEEMAHNGIHFHIYGDVFQNQARATLDEARALVPDYIHLHPSCPSEKWLEEFSRYDAGWLHWHHSRNSRDISRMDWPDFNSPARMSTYAVAGVPMIMADNTGHRVHYQEYLTTLGMGLPVSSFNDLANKLKNKELMTRLRTDSWRNRYEFCFDTFLPDLERFFMQAIYSYNRRKQQSKTTSLWQI